MPLSRQRGTPAAAEDCPARWRGRVAFSKESSAGSDPRGVRRPLPLGLRKAMQLNPNGGAAGGDTFRGSAHCPRETLPRKRSPIRPGNARPAQQRDSPCSCRPPRKTRPAERRAELRAHPTVAAIRCQSAEGQPRLPAGLGDFTPALLARTERLVFRCLSRQNQKPLRRVESEWRAGSKARASRLQTLPILTASGAGCRRRRHLGTLRFPRAFLR